MENEGNDILASCEEQIRAIQTVPLSHPRGRDFRVEQLRDFARQVFDITQRMARAGKYFDPRRRALLHEGEILAEDARLWAARG